MKATIASVVVAVLVVATVATPVAAGSDAEPSLVVELHEDGSADVVLTLTYDLNSDDERDAFRTLENDSDTRTQVRDRFADRMASVAASAENATGREMRVSDATIDVYTTEGGETGVVELGVRWHGLAAVEGDRLVVTQPFASGFETDRRVAFVPPEGYELAEATPEPATDGRRATWSPGTDLEGFEATFAPSDDAEETSSGATTAGSGSEDSSASNGVAGFGLPLGVVSLVAAVLLARFR